MKRTTSFFGLWAVLSALGSPPAWAASEASVLSELQPHVENHEFAGAVALVASKDKVLNG